MKRVLSLCLYLFIPNYIQAGNENLDASNFSAANSFSICCTTTTQNQTLVSIFGVKEVEHEFDNLSVQFQYGIADTILTSTLVSGGTITNANSEAILSTSGTTGAVAGLQSKTNLEYISGHEANAQFTAAFTGAIANNTQQYIGIIDSDNGFGVGFNGTSFGVVSRNNGTDTFVSQSNFNGDKLNGTGPSQFNYDYTKLNVFRISYGWLGASIIKFQIMNSNGNWITFHIIKQPNSSSFPSIANAMLPISAQVFDRAGGSSLTLRTASWNMGIVSIQSSAANRYFAITNTAAIPLLTETHLLTLRNPTTFQSLPNKINVTFANYIIGDATGAINPLILRIYKNATVAGTSFSNVSAGNSVCTFSTAGTYTIGTGTLLLIAPFSEYNVGKIMIQPYSIYNIIAYPNDQLTVTIQAPSGASTIIGGLEWSEGF